MPASKIELGQVWRLPGTEREQTIRIDRIAFATIQCAAWGDLKSTGRRCKMAFGLDESTGECVEVQARHLERGHLGARLLARADGTAVVRAGPKVEPTHKRKPGERPPRGVIRREISLFETQCVQLVARGQTYAAIARTLGTGEATVRNAVENVRQIRAAREMGTW
jgi:hypothetical protein